MDATSTDKPDKPAKIGRTFLPNPGDMFFVIVLFMLMIQRPHYLFGDGGTGWHLTTGHYILQHHQIPTTDFISYVTAGKPWIALYWFGDLLLAMADSWAGQNGVALISAASIAFLMLLLYRRTRETGCHLVIACVITALGAIASCVHWFARPHILSFFGTYFFATALEDFYRGKISAKRMILILIATTIVWTNSHPGFAAGFVLCGVYLAVTVCQFLFSKTAELRQKARGQALAIAATLGICIASTLLNPGGIQLHIALKGYFAASKMVDLVKEYQSPSFHGAVEMTSLELLFFMMVVGLMIRKKAFSVPQALASLAFAHLALTSVRYMPLFVIVALPFIAGLYAQPALSLVTTRSDAAAAGSEPEPKSVKLWESLSNWWRQLGERLNIVEMSSNTYASSWLVLIALVIVVSMGGNAFGSKLINAGFDPQKFPTTSLDYIKTAKLPIKKGFNEANWGGYINYQSKLPIFIDDRAILFGDDFYYEYASAVNLVGWKEYLDKHGIEWVIFPKDHTFAEELKLTPGWVVLNEDPAAVILSRKPPAGTPASSNKTSPAATPSAPPAPPESSPPTK